MALSFPLSLDAFFDGIGIADLSLDLSESLEVGETGGGEIIPVDHGPRLWQGSVSVRAGSSAEGDQVVARAELLRQANASFFVSPRHRWGPQADPTGAALAGATPVISSLPTGSREIGVSGLPAYYRLTQGDFLSFAYLDGPTRYAFHRVVSTVDASDAGTTGAVELMPMLRPGLEIGASLVLVRPFFKARMVPGSFKPQTQRSTATYGYSFSFRQTLR